MRIKEEFKKMGYFWIPAESDRRIPGTLSILDGGQIELEVFGLFGEFGKNPKPIGRIVGHIKKEGFVTLDGCSYTRMSSSSDTSRTFEDISTASISVDRVFIGVAYREGEVPLFDTLIFSIEGIDEWVGISGIEDDYQFEKNTATISYKLPENIPLKLDNGMELLIVFGWKPRELVSKRKAGVAQKTYFHLVSQDVSELEEFISIAKKITAFLCFAINKIVSLDSMSTTFENYHKDIREHLTEENPINVDIYCHSWPHSKDYPDIHPAYFLFRFEDIQSKVESILNKWIKGWEHFEPAFHLYFWTQMRGYPYIEVFFLTLAQGLEAYHRRKSNEKQMNEDDFKKLVGDLIDQCPKEKREWLKGKLAFANELSLRKRLQRLIEPFKDVFGNREKCKSLINKIVDIRNNLTHPDTSYASADIDEIWPLCIKMELLFQLHFLQLIGFSEEEIKSIVYKCPQLKEKL